MQGDNTPEERSSRSPEELKQLFESTEDLIGKVLGALKASGISADDEELRAFGRQGLMEAATRFDPAKGSDFRRFAYFRVRGAMLDGLRKMGNWSRRGYERITLMRSADAASESEGQGEEEVATPSKAEAAARLRKHMAAMTTAMTVGVFADHALQKGGELVAVDSSASAEERLADQQMSELVKKLILELPPPEDEVISRFYVQGERMDDIAQTLSCSKSWVSRIHSRALKRMGARLRASK